MRRRLRGERKPRGPPDRFEPKPVRPLTDTGTILTGVAIVFAVSVAAGALVALLVRIVVPYPRCSGVIAIAVPAASSRN